MYWRQILEIRFRSKRRRMEREDEAECLPEREGGEEAMDAE